MKDKYRSTQWKISPLVAIHERIEFTFMRARNYIFSRCNWSRFVPKNTREKHLGVQEGERTNKRDTPIARYNSFLITPRGAHLISVVREPFGANSQADQADRSQKYSALLRSANNVGEIMKPEGDDTFIFLTFPF